MYRLFFYLFLFGVVLAWLPASNAKVIIPSPSPHTVQAKPVKYTAYHSYLAGDGTVEDRGGAIVKKGQRGYAYDRLDIWMGHGDAGRIAANNWGKRTVEGCILN